MGRSQQRKGRRAELELCRVLNDLGFTSVRPGEAVSFGSEPDVLGLEGVHVEVKRREGVDLNAALRQAAEDATYFGGIPAVFHRGNRQNWRVTMGLTDWLKLYQVYNNQ